MQKIEMDWKQRRKNKCDVVDCAWSCKKCGFNPVVKEERLRKRFPNYKGGKTK